MLGGLTERGPRFDSGGFGDCSRPARQSRVVVDDVEDLHHLGGDLPLGGIDLPHLIRCGCFEPTPRTLRTSDEGGSGLASIAARAAQMGGDTAIERRNPAVTLVRWTVPLAHPS